MSPRGRCRSRRFNVHRSFAFRFCAPPDHQLTWRRSVLERRQSVEAVGPGSRTGTPSLKNVSHTRQQVWTWVHVQPSAGTLAKSLAVACVERRQEIASEVPWRLWLHRGMTVTVTIPQLRSQGRAQVKHLVSPSARVCSSRRWRAGFAARDCFSPWSSCTHPHRPAPWLASTAASAELRARCARRAPKASPRAWSDDDATVG
jgi:hypothetical protein